MEGETKVPAPVSFLGLVVIPQCFVTFPRKGRLETVQQLPPKHCCDLPGSLTYYCILSASQDMPS